MAGLFNSLVQSGNLAAAGVTSLAITLSAQQVEDASLQTIQYVTPGLLAWAVATGAMFGAALTLVTWRQKKILRRLRLSPVGTGTIVGARVGVSIVIALVQTAIFIGVALIPYFGLRLSDYWWMSIPLIIVGTLAFWSIGLLAGSFSKTPEAAMVANLIVLPMAFLSGAFFLLRGRPGGCRRSRRLCRCATWSTACSRSWCAGRVRPPCCRRWASCSPSPSWSRRSPWRCSAGTTRDPRRRRCGGNPYSCWCTCGVNPRQ